MKAFTTLKAIAAPLDMMNVDTDIIIPKQFLKTVKRTGLGVSAFYNIRYDDSGAPLSDFVLNQDVYSTAEILITGENFGCGSSREHAVWALAEYGFRSVIAPSFAPIFAGNCVRNGILPAVLESEAIEEIARAGTPVTVDLTSGTTVRPALTAELPAKMIAIKESSAASVSLPAPAPLKPTEAIKFLPTVGVTLTVAFKYLPAVLTKPWNG